MELFDTRFFEMLFLICFGISWPMNIIKAVCGKTSKGVSLWFLLVCFIGYIFGIIAKLVDDTLSYTLIFYCLNICMVGTCVMFYFINAHRDKLADEAAQDAASSQPTSDGGDGR